MTKEMNPTIADFGCIDRLHQSEVRLSVRYSLSSRVRRAESANPIPIVERTTPTIMVSRSVKTNESRSKHAKVEKLANMIERADQLNHHW